jgi:hypothetical protein
MHDEQKSISIISRRDAKEIMMSKIRQSNHGIIVI